MFHKPETELLVRKVLRNMANKARSAHAKTRARAPDGTFLPETDHEKRRRRPRSYAALMAGRYGISVRKMYQLQALAKNHHDLLLMVRAGEISIRAAYDISRDAGIEYLFLGKVMPLKTALDIVRKRQVPNFVEIMEIDGIPYTQRVVVRGEIELDEALELIKNGEIFEFEATLRNIAEFRRRRKQD